MAAELQHLKQFMRERFHSEPEAASFIGGPAGPDAVLSYEEFARALRLSGYGRSTETLFTCFGHTPLPEESAMGVMVRDLLRDCGLPREQLSAGSGLVGFVPDELRRASAASSGSPGPVRQGLSLGHMSPSAPGVEPGIGPDQLQELKAEVAALRRRLATWDAAERQEDFPKGSAAAGNLAASMRADLAEAMRQLAEERRERLVLVAESQRRMRELQVWTEERLQRVEGLAKEGRQGTVDIRAAVQEALQLGEMSEFRALDAVAEEVRNREATLQREQQTREAMATDLETRWRRLLQEERAMRSRETEDVVGRVGRFEELLRASAQRFADMDSRVDEVLRELHEESNIRQAEFSQLASHREQLTCELGDFRAAVRDESGAVHQQYANLDKAQRSTVERLEHDMTSVRQNLVELRLAVQSSNTSNEDSRARLQALLDNETHVREEAVGRLMMQHDSTETRMEQTVRELLRDERTAREEAEGQLEQRLAALQQELAFERAKASAQGRELSQALAQTRDSLASEVQARRQEAAAERKATEEARAFVGEGEQRIDRLEARLAEQVAALDDAIRGESRARQDAERRLSDERSGTRAAAQREVTALREELSSRLMGEFELERFRRSVSQMDEAKTQVEQLLARLAEAESAIGEERESREQAFQRIEARVLHGEQAFGADRGERDESSRNLGSKIAAIMVEVNEARDRTRDCLLRCEELAGLREEVGRERLERQEGEGRLDLAFREQQARLEQLLQEGTTREKGFCREIGELREKIEVESRQRLAGDTDIARQMGLRREELLAAVTSEARRMDEAIAMAEGAFREAVAEEGAKWREATSALDLKWQQLRDAADETSKWRIEQYSEVTLELSKVSDLLAEEAKARLKDVQALTGNMSRLRDDISGEANSRKASVSALQEDISATKRLLEQKQVDSAQSQVQRGGDIDGLRREVAAEVARMSGLADQLKHAMDQEALVRDETMAAASRSWKSSIAKASDEFRASLRNESASREEMQSRLDQQVVDLRGLLHELRAIGDQREDEVSARLKAAAEALSVEDDARRSQELVVGRALEELRGLIAAEGVERQGVAEQLAGRLQNVEETLHEEAAVRDDSERRIGKAVLDARAALSEERSAREGLQGRLEEAIAQETSQRLEAMQQEVRLREEAIASLSEQVLKSVQTERAIREEQFRDSNAKAQQMRIDLHEEVEERAKLGRDLGGSLTRLRRLISEEEETRVQEGERLNTVVEGLQEAVRSWSTGKDEVLQRALEAVDILRASLHKESAARGAKVDSLEGSVRDLRVAVSEETQRRDSQVRSVAETIVEERSAREAALSRERRATEEEIVKVQQQLRKAREEEERRLQERLLDVTGAVTEERDQRVEALRQERQKNSDVHEQLKQESKLVQREASKISQALQKALEDDARRGKAVEAQLAGLAARCEEARAAFSAEQQLREDAAQRAERRLAEQEAAVRAEAKERREAVDELRRGLEAEAASRTDDLDSDRRAREAGDSQVEERLKSFLREDRASWEAAVAQLAKDVVAAKAKLVEDLGQEASERSEQRAALQKLRADLGELLGERKAEAGAVQEVVEQLRTEVAAVHSFRREDLERLDSSLAALATKIDQGARGTKEQASRMTETLQGLQADLSREAEERGAALRRLEARGAEERRLADAALAAEARAREDAAKASEESLRQRLSDEARRMKSAVDKVAAQLGALSEDMDKFRLANPEQQRDFAKGLAALQKHLSSEEQLRHQSVAAMQRSVDALRDELLAETKERRAQAVATLEEVSMLQRGLQLRGDRGDPAQQQLASDLVELRERLARESRTREAAISQIEQRLASTKAMLQHAGDHRAGSPAPGAGAGPKAAVIAGASGSALASERWRQLEEETQQTRSALAALQAEQQALSKSVIALEERGDSVRTNLGSATAALADVQKRQRASFEVDLQIVAYKEEVRKESSERRAEVAQLAARISEGSERIEWAEQQRIKGEGALRQEVMDIKNGLKKEVRDREASEARLGSLLREETTRREEADDREARARKEADEQLAEVFQGSLRDERRTRERESARLEDRSLTLVGGPSPKRTSFGALCAPDDTSDLRQAVVDLQDRVGAAEVRQKSSEERTVSMLDAIMSGLMGPAAH